MLFFLLNTMLLVYQWKVLKCFHPSFHFSICNTHFLLQFFSPHNFSLTTTTRTLSFPWWVNFATFRCNNCRTAAVCLASVDPESWCGLHCSHHITSSLAAGSVSEEKRCWRNKSGEKNLSVTDEAARNQLARHRLVFPTELDVFGGGIQLSRSTVSLWSSFRRSRGAC